MHRSSAFIKFEAKNAAQARNSQPICGKNGTRPDGPPIWKAGIPNMAHQYLLIA
jgi:hypothetical protein